MTEQFSAMMCGLRGKGLNVVEAHMCTPEKHGLRADHFSSECKQLSVDLPPRARDFYERARTVPVARWSDYGVPREGAYIHDTDTFLVRKGFGRFKSTDFEEVIRLGGAILSSYGLHYNVGEEVQYRKDIEDLFRLAKSSQARRYRPHRRPTPSGLSPPAPPFFVSVASPVYIDCHLFAHTFVAPLIVLISPPSYVRPFVLQLPFYMKELSAQHFLGTGAFEDWSQARSKPHTQQSVHTHRVTGVTRGLFYLA